MPNKTFRIELYTTKTRILEYCSLPLSWTPLQISLRNANTCLLTRALVDCLCLRGFWLVLPTHGDRSCLATILRCTCPAFKARSKYPLLLSPAIWPISWGISCKCPIITLHEWCYFSICLGTVNQKLCIIDTPNRRTWGRSILKIRWIFTNFHCSASFLSTTCIAPLASLHPHALMHDHSFMGKESCHCSVIMSGQIRDSQDS